MSFPKIEAGVNMDLDLLMSTTIFFVLATLSCRLFFPHHLTELLITALHTQLLPFSYTLSKKNMLLSMMCIVQQAVQFRSMCYNYGVEVRHATMKHITFKHSLYSKSKQKMKLSGYWTYFSIRQEWIKPNSLDFGFVHPCFAECIQNQNVFFNYGHAIISAKFTKPVSSNLSETWLTVVTAHSYVKLSSGKVCCKALASIEK